MSALTMADLTLPCAQQSLLAGEALAGSAVGPIHLWLLIEHRGHWERNVESTLPEPFALELAALGVAFPTLRVQLIRRKEASARLSLYLLRSPEQQLGSAAVIEHRLVDDVDQARAIDWHAVLAGEPLGATQNKPMYLVCTHGRRDRCCAQLGVPLWHALRRAAPAADVWQVSHIGGHRFAPTLIYLPHGMCYGRLPEAEVDAMLQAHARGELYALERCRGQTRFAPAAQAAALWWRRQHQRLELDALRSAQLVNVAGGYHVTLYTADNSEIALRVDVRRDGRAQLSSCGADKPSPLSDFAVSLRTDLQAGVAP